MTARSLVLVVALLSAISSSVRAGKAEDAKQHHDRAATLYNLQEFAEAAAEYQKAHELGGNANDLYNIGQSYRMGGQKEKAIGSYRAFLQRSPTGQVADHVRKLIAELEVRLAAEKAAAAPTAVTATPPPTKGTPARKRPARPAAKPGFDPDGTL